MIRNTKTGVERFEGFVLGTGTGATFNDGYDWSLIATVWNPLAGAPFTVCYGSTMGCDETVTVDATDEVKALYQAWSDRQAMMLSLRRSIRYEGEIRRGALVRVVRGRKVPIGTEGEVFWYGETRWGRRVGIRPVGSDPRDRSNGVFTAASNVEVIETERARELRAQWDALQAETPTELGRVA